MADNTVDVKFGGDSGDAQKAIADASKALKEGVGQMQNSLSTLTTGFDKFKGVLIGFTAALAGGKLFKDSISAANEWNGSVMKLAKSMGTTSEQASIMAVALNHIGVSTEQYAGASMTLSRQLSSNEDAFKTLGIETRNTATGAFRPAGEIMADVNEKLKSIKNVTEQNIAGQKVYGRGWGEMKGILKLTKEAMVEAEETAKRLHLIVGPEGIAQTRKYKESQRDLALVSKSLEIQIGEVLLPQMVKLGSFMGEEGPRMGEIFATVLQTIVAVAQTAYLAIVRLGEGLGAFAAMGAAILHGDLAGAKEIYDDNIAKGEQFVDRMLKIWEHAYDKPAAPKGKDDDDKTPHIDYGGGKGSPDKRFQEWKNEREQEKEAEGEFFKSSLARDEEFWNEKLALVQGKGEKETQIRRQVQHELFAIHKAQAEQGRALADEEISRIKKRASDEIDVEKEKLRTKKELGQIDDQQELQALAVLADKEYQIELDSLNSQIDLYGQDLVAKQKLLDAKEALERQHAKAIQKINNDTLIAEKKQIDQLLSPITSAIEKSITGMIQGTLTMKKALSGIFTAILGEFVSMAAKMAMKWAATEAAKTLSSTSGNEARKLSDTMAATEAISTKSGEAMGVIGANAGEAASGAASSVASIPYVGPMMAAAAFAATLAMVLGAKSSVPSARGGFDIPAGVNPLTQLHEREMVLPAAQADAVRDMAAGGSAGGAVHLHVHTQSTQDFAKFLKNNSQAVAASARVAARNFSSSRKA